MTRIALRPWRRHSHSASRRTLHRAWIMPLTSRPWGWNLPKLGGTLQKPGRGSPTWSKCCNAWWVTLTRLLPRADTLRADPLSLHQYRVCLCCSGAHRQGPRHHRALELHDVGLEESPPQQALVVWTWSASSGKVRIQLRPKKIWIWTAGHDCVWNSGASRYPAYTVLLERVWPARRGGGCAGERVSQRRRAHCRFGDGSGVRGRQRRRPVQCLGITWRMLRTRRRVLLGF